MDNADNVYQPRELLAEVDAAIQKVMVGGQSYRLGNRSLTRADLSKLWEMRNTLAAQAAGEDDSCLLPGTAAAFFEGR
ncbi:MAG: peptidylprolyl isomerase [Oscillospiraceae bacterium]|nr:peptidylprolyl isomerase [Oscillospiraceae bacterium]